MIRAAHPVPSAAVTATATLLAISAGNSAGTCALLAAAVLAGQLWVGWSNDRIDVHRDRRVQHEGKPLAEGAVPLRLVDIALALSLAATVALSLLLGWRAGLLHLAAVALAGTYNMWLKGTPASWVPYGLAFGALPAVATFALPTHPAPHPWILGAAALLGIAVNFANAEQQLAAHPLSDVHGAPDRIGGRASLLVTAVLTAGVSAMVTWLPSGPPDPLAWTGAAITLAWLLVGTPLLWRQADTRRPFYWLLLPLSAVQIVVLVITARPLH